MNLGGIAKAKFQYVQDIDKVVKAILSEDRSARILYHGAFESAFVFYTRKNDSDRKARVFRTANELNDPENLLGDIIQQDINFIAIESEDLRKAQHGGVYSNFYIELNDLIKQKENLFQNIANFRALYGQPHKEKKVYLKIYKVKGIQQKDSNSVEDATIKRN